MEKGEDTLRILLEAQKKYVKVLEETISKEMPATEEIGLRAQCGEGKLTCGGGSALE